MTACIGLRGANGISGGSSGSRSYIPASLLRTSGPPTTSKFQSPEWSCRSSDQRSFVSTSRALLYRGPTKFSRLKREVRIDYPPKVRSSIYKLPVFSKLCFVTEGWYKDGENRKVETPVLSFARGTIHTQIESLTQGEVEKCFSTFSTSNITQSRTRTRLS